MKLRNTILSLSMLMCAQAFAMEAPPQKPSERGVSLLLDLPTDIKGYLLPFVLQGNQIEMEKAIFTMASTSTHFNKSVNNPQVMLSILNAVAERSPYVAHAVALAERLQTKEKTLPVMRDPLIVAWIAKTKASLENGRELRNLIMFSIAPIEEDIEQLKNYFKNKKIDINCKIDGNTPLLTASNLSRNKIIEFLLSHGADARVLDDNGCTTLMHLNYRTTPETIVSLIRAGANPNIPANNGCTPLVKAIIGCYENLINEVTNAYENLIKVLLENGADPELVVTLGGQCRSAYDWVVKLEGCSASPEQPKKKNAILAMLDEAIAKKKQKLALKEK